MSAHHDLIRDQFTRQAVPFSTAPAIADEAILRALVEATGAGPEDTSLDVACGPGLVVSAFARVVRHATGIDLTPAMIERGRQLATQRELVNVSWRVGDVVPLPWPDASFSIVTSRYAFHHFQDPGAVLAEMRRVCRPGGAVAVMDLTSSPDAGRAQKMNRMAKLLDPSHVWALAPADLEALFARAGLAAPRVTRHRLEVELEGVLARTFPNPGDDDEVRRMFADSLADDGMALDARKVGEQIRFAYPVVLLVARR